MYRTVSFLILFLINSASFAFSYTVEVTEQQLQDRLIRMMPIQKEKFFVTVILSDPKLELIKDGNRIGLFANLKMTAPGGIQGNGRAKVIGGISYKKETGSFYLHNPKIAQFEIDQIPAQFHSNIRELAQMALNHSMTNRALITLQDDKVQQKLAKSVLESVTVGDKKLLLTLNIQ